MSHQLKRFTTDGTKVITNKNVPGHQVEEATFEPHEAYAVDIVVSTGSSLTFDRLAQMWDVFACARCPRA